MGNITLRQALEEYKIHFYGFSQCAQRTSAWYVHNLEDLIHFLEQPGVKYVLGVCCLVLTPGWGPPLIRCMIR
jgi:hypothetical protein